MATTRREFLAAGGAAPVALVALGAQSGSRELTMDEKANVKVVNDFSAAWATGDASTIASHLSEDAVFRFSRDGDTVTGGRGALQTQLESGFENMRSIEFDVLETFSAGPLVANLRVDYITNTDGERNGIRVAGVFYLKDGKIVEWIDAIVPA